MHSNKLKTLAAAVALAVPFMANAASDINSGPVGPALNASAAVDFLINIPKVIYLRVGTGVPLADDPTVDLITFNVAAANVGGGTVSGIGGDLTGGVVTARLIGNNGDISFNVTTGGALSNGSGDSISHSQITTTVTPLPLVANLLAAPVLADGAGTAINVAATAKVVNHGAQWQYQYLNAAVVPPGAYGGVNTNNGRATYTASMP